MKLADRVNKIQPSPTLAIDAKAKALKAQGVDIIGFGAGEPDFDTPANIKEAAKKAIDAGFTKYTAVGGTDELKDAIIAKLKNDNGLVYTRNEVSAACGAKHSLYNISQALVQEGDEVIIPSPYWVSYPDQVILAEASRFLSKPTRPAHSRLHRSSWKKPSQKTPARSSSIPPATPPAQPTAKMN